MPIVGTQIARKLGDVIYPVDITTYKIPAMPSLGAGNESCFMAPNSYFGLQAWNNNLNPCNVVDNLFQFNLMQAAIYCFGPFGIYYYQATLPNPFTYYPISFPFSMLRSSFPSFGQNTMLMSFASVIEGMSAGARMIRAPNILFSNETSSPKPVNTCLYFVGAPANYFSPSFTIYDQFSQGFVPCQSAGNMLSSPNLTSDGFVTNIPNPTIENLLIATNMFGEKMNLFFAPIVGNVDYVYNTGGWLVDPVFWTFLTCSTAFGAPGYMVGNVGGIANSFVRQAPNYFGLQLSDETDNHDMGSGNNGSPYYSLAPDGGFCIFGFDSGSGQVTNNIYIVSRDLSSYIALRLKPQSPTAQSIISLIPPTGIVNHWGFDFGGNLWVMDSTANPNNLIGPTGLEKSLTLPLFDSLTMRSLGCRLLSPSTMTWEG